MADKPKCFIIMPITTPPNLVEQYGGDKDHFKHVLESLFVPAVKAAEMTPISPITKGANVIHATIINQLEKADFVLCDISALNANVFFELGMRVAMNKPLVYVRDDLTKIPFDTGVINHYEYDSKLLGWTIDKDRTSLTAHIKTCQTEPGRSLFDYFSLSAAAHLRRDGDPEKDRLDYLTLKVDEIARRLEWGTNKFPTGLSPKQAAEIRLAENVFEMLKGRTPKLPIVVTDPDLITLRFPPGNNYHSKADLALLAKDVAEATSLPVRIETSNGNHYQSPAYKFRVDKNGNLFQECEDGTGE